MRSILTRPRLGLKNRIGLDTARDTRARTRFNANTAELKSAACIPANRDTSCELKVYRSNL